MASARSRTFTACVLPSTGMLHCLVSASSYFLSMTQFLSKRRGARPFCRPLAAGVTETPDHVDKHWSDWMLQRNDRNTRIVGFTAEGAEHMGF